MAKRKKRNRGGGVPFNPDVDTGTKRPVTARVAVGDVNDKFSDYPSNGLTPRRLHTDGNTAAYPFQDVQKGLY